ncbi:DUF1697 domain-containing protein [Actinokineospora sp.]|uniref:DUF1697 domain-containing protein n=1 Tax=Actinokineospora sp. TaxID=1872133 RepID=UPI004037E7B3
MSGFVALLRGVNVSGHKKIAMADLRVLLTDLGFGDVRTLLQSGNAAFTADDSPASLESRIEDALVGRFELATRCLVRTGDELRAVLAAHPLVSLADNGSRMLAIFLSDDPDPALAATHDPVALDPEHVRVGKRVIYQWCPDGVAEAPLVGPFVERRWKVTATGRNWNTVTKLAAMV